MVYNRRYGKRRPAMYARRRYKARSGFKRSGKYRRQGFNNRFRGSGGGMQSELKFHSTNHSSKTVSSGGSVDPNTLLVLPQGTTQNQRIGRKVIIRVVQLNMSFKKDPTAGAGAFGAVDTVSVGLFLDKQANGAAAAYLDLFDSANGPLALRNLDNTGRFEIFKKWLFVMNSTGAGMSHNSADVLTQEVTASSKVLRYYKKCAIPVIYTGATGAITELTSNNIAMWAISENTVPLVTWDLSVRIRYADM